jgi:hypothetical protein
MCIDADTTTTTLEKQLNLAFLAGELLQLAGCSTPPTIEELRTARHIVDLAAAYIRTHDPMPPDHVFASAFALLDHAARLGLLKDPDWCRRASDGALQTRIPLWARLN